MAEVFPYGPCGVTGPLSSCGNASRGSFLNKADFISNSCSFGGWTRVQEGCTGKHWFIYARNVSSGRCKRREQQSAIWLV
jgi:hypothetical protein